MNNTFENQYFFTRIVKKITQRTKSIINFINTMMIWYVGILHSIVTPSWHSDDDDDINEVPTRLHTNRFMHQNNTMCVLVFLIYKAAQRSKTQNTDSLARNVMHIPVAINNAHTTNSSISKLRFQRLHK